MKLAPIFGHHMVFAANKPILIWGQGKGEVTVRFAEFEQTVKAQNGMFFAAFRPMPYSGPHMLMVSSGDEEVILFDIFVGEVYLFAGQSNMQFKLGESNYPEYNYESNSALRLFSTRRMEAGEPFIPEDGWVTAKEDALAKWPALPYLTARRIAEQNPGIAVGIIACYQGASVIESWLPKGALKAAGIRLKKEDLHPDHTHEIYGAWNREGQLYDFALSQVKPYPLSGVIWYQGESDTTIAEAAVYTEELRTLIEIWRRDFGNPLLPFVVIQIADYDYPHDKEGWRALQAAQNALSGSMRNVSVVASADVCEHDDIHPKTKDKLAARVAAVLDNYLS